MKCKSGKTAILIVIENRHDHPCIIRQPPAVRPWLREYRVEDLKSRMQIPREESRIIATHRICPVALTNARGAKPIPFTRADMSYVPAILQARIPAAGMPQLPGYA